MLKFANNFKAAILIMFTDKKGNNHKEWMDRKSEYRKKIERETKGNSRTEKY